MSNINDTTYISGILGSHAGSLYNKFLITQLHSIQTSTRLKNGITNVRNFEALYLKKQAKNKRLKKTTKNPQIWETYAIGLANILSRKKIAFLA